MASRNEVLNKLAALEHLKNEAEGDAMKALKVCARIQEEIDAVRAEVSEWGADAPAGEGE
jgi:hypothetical protein